MKDRVGRTLHAMGVAFFGMLAIFAVVAASAVLSVWLVNTLGEAIGFPVVAAAIVSIVAGAVFWFD